MRALICYLSVAIFVSTFNKLHDRRIPRDECVDLFTYSWRRPSLLFCFRCTYKDVKQENVCTCGAVWFVAVDPFCNFSDAYQYTLKRQTTAHRISCSVLTWLTDRCLGWALHAPLVSMAIRHCDRHAGSISISRYICQQLHVIIMYVVLIAEVWLPSLRASCSRSHHHTDVWWMLRSLAMLHWIRQTLLISRARIRRRKICEWSFLIPVLWWYTYHVSKRQTPLVTHSGNSVSS